jgi:hypothetical protein
MTTQEEIQGQEYDWLAADSEGLVGFFSTAGGGYAPQAFLDDVNAFDSAIAAVLSLPATGSATCFRELRTRLTNTWKLVAERGLYAFDSSPLGGAYRLIATPDTPARLKDLPASVGHVAGRVVLPDVTFRSSSEITESQIRHQR